MRFAYEFRLAIKINRSDTFSIKCSTVTAWWNSRILLLQLICRSIPTESRVWWCTKKHVEKHVSRVEIDRTQWAKFLSRSAAFLKQSNNNNVFNNDHVRSAMCMCRLSNGTTGWSFDSKWSINNSNYEFEHLLQRCLFSIFPMTTRS